MHSTRGNAHGCAQMPPGTFEQGQRAARSYDRRIIPTVRGIRIVVGIHFEQQSVLCDGGIGLKRPDKYDGDNADKNYEQLFHVNSP